MSFESDQDNPGQNFTRYCSHDFTIDSQWQEGRVRLVFALTAVAMVVEIAAGLGFGSMALLADGWHMGTHAAAFAITLFAYNYSRRHRYNAAYSFGTGKTLSLGGFASAVAMAVVALMMAVESLQRLFSPHNIRFDEALVVAVLGLLINLVSAFLLKGHSHGGFHSPGQQDHNIKAAYFHVMADALTSVLAIAALIVGKTLGWIWVDAAMGIVGSLIIAWWAWGLLRETSVILLDKTTNPGAEQAIRQAVEESGGIISDLHLWQVAPDHQAAMVSVDSASGYSPAYFKRLIREHYARVHYPPLSHLTVEVNPEQEEKTAAFRDTGNKAK